jgi:hypothetical protein
MRDYTMWNMVVTAVLAVVTGLVVCWVGTKTKKEA